MGLPDLPKAPPFSDPSKLARVPFSSSDVATDTPSSDKRISGSAWNAPDERAILGKSAMPASSRMLDELVKANNLDLLNPADRKLLINSLEVVKSKAPAVHISFAADPPQAALEKIITWLRREIHPVLLLQIGLQPTIAAGCILRTPNKVFDFSLQKYFSSNKDLLISKLQEKAEQASL